MQYTPLFEINGKQKESVLAWAPVELRTKIQNSSTDRIPNPLQLFSADPTMFLKTAQNSTELNIRFIDSSIQ